MLIAHLTDPHIGLDPGPLAGHIDPTPALRRALAHVRTLRPAPEVVLLTGDLSDRGRAEDYKTIRQLLNAELPARASGGPLVLAIVGNHDLRAHARRHLGDALPVAADAPADLLCLHAAHGGLHFIGLDTVVAGQPHGALDAVQLDWLERQLARCAGQPVVVLMHHPPLVTGMTKMDAYGLLHGRAELGRLIAAHGGVQLIACGHLHRPVLGALGGAPVVVAPSTSHQLDLNLQPGAALACSLEPPMIGLYRWTLQDGMACHFSYVTPFGAPQPV